MLLRLGAKFSTDSQVNVTHNSIQWAWLLLRNILVFLFLSGRILHSLWGRIYFIFISFLGQLCEGGFGGVKFCKYIFFKEGMNLGKNTYIKISSENLTLCNRRENERN